MQNLRVSIYTAGVNLKSLPKSVTTLPNLRELDLSENKLSELPKGIEKMNNSQTIDISNNNFPSFSLILLYSRSLITIRG